MFTCGWYAALITLGFGYKRGSMLILVILSGVVKFLESYINDQLKSFDDVKSHLIKTVLMMFPISFFVLIFIRWNT